MVPLVLALALAASAESIQLREAVLLDAPARQGAFEATVAIFDRLEGGAELWASAPLRGYAEEGDWLFAGAPGPPGRALPERLPGTVYLEFRLPGAVLRPRHAFRVSRDSTPDRLLLENAPAVSALEPPDSAVEPLRLAGRIAAGPAPAPAPPPQERDADGRRDTSLAELRLSNDLYYQAVRDYGKGAPRQALERLDRALRANPGNAEARELRERIGQELQPAAASAPLTPDAARAANELYFQALRQYGKGQLRQAHDTLVQAAREAPADRGIGTALLRLRRELALMPRVH
ncbi:MAG: hypothetical protein HY554_07075 [Elusimicrobia bacterium]|nr:hypothetical protein [Elusimicrobiota bacterium]